MSFTPNKQYAEGDDLSINPVGPLVQTRDSVTGLAVPLTLGKEGADQDTVGTGLLGWLKAISDALGLHADTGQSLAGLVSQLAYSISLTLSYLRNSDITNARGIPAIVNRTSDNTAQFLQVDDAGLLKVTARASVTALVSDVKTIGTSSALVTTGARSSLYLRNTSTSGQVIWLAFGTGNAAVVSHGISLMPTETYEMSPEQNDGGQVHAISTALSGQLAVQEWSYS